MYKSFNINDVQETVTLNEPGSSLISTLLLVIRLGNLAAMVALLTMHMRSVRVFRWEQSISGGLVVTYLVAVAGLALCAGTQGAVTKGIVLQSYLCTTGVVLLTLNAASLWNRWRRAGELTRAIADLIAALGIPLRTQVLIKVALSLTASCIFLIDLLLVILVLRVSPPIELDDT